MSKKIIVIVLTVLIGIVIGQFLASLGYNIFPMEEKPDEQIVENPSEVKNDKDDADENITEENDINKEDTPKEEKPKDNDKSSEEPVEEAKNDKKEEIQQQEPEVKEDKPQKTAQEIIEEAQRKEEERQRKLEEERRKQEEQENNTHKEQTNNTSKPPVDTSTGKRTETRIERIPAPKAPDRDFTVIKKSKNATLYFEKGYKEDRIADIVKYYEEEVYPDLTKYYKISKPRDVKFYFLSKRSARGIYAHMPTSVADPDGFYSYGHIYIYPEDIMHNMKRIIRHEYTHHLNNHYYDGGIPMYMDEGMAFYIMNYYYMDENEKNTAANVYGVKTDYKTYHNSKYLFLVLDRYLKDNKKFPEYFKHIKDYTHAKAFELTFGMTEKQFEKIYSEYVK